MYHGSSISSNPNDKNPCPHGTYTLVEGDRQLTSKADPGFVALVAYIIWGLPLRERIQNKVEDLVRNLCK